MHRECLDLKQNVIRFEVYYMTDRVYAKMHCQLFCTVHASVHFVVLCLAIVFNDWNGVQLFMLLT